MGLIRVSHMNEHALARRTSRLTGESSGTENASLFVYSNSCNATMFVKQINKTKIKTKKLENRTRDAARVLYFKRDSPRKQRSRTRTPSRKSRGGYNVLEQLEIPSNSPGETDPLFSPPLSLSRVVRDPPTGGPAPLESRSR